MKERKSYQANKKNGYNKCPDKVVGEGNPATREDQKKKITLITIGPLTCRFR